MSKDSGLQSAIRLYLCIILQVTWWLWQPYRSSGPASTTWGLSDVPDRSWALLDLVTVGLYSCWGNIWASAEVVRMGGCWEIIFCIWEAIQDCVFQPLWCWVTNLSLPLSLSLSLSGFHWISDLERKGSRWYECLQRLLMGGKAHSPLRQLLIESRLARYLPQACIS